MADLSRKRWDIDFDVAKSMRYHAYRRSFFEFSDRFAKIVILVSGMSAFAALLDTGPAVALVATGFVAFVAATDIIIGFSRRALLHDNLYRDFSLLSQDIAKNITPTGQDIAAWVARRREIEMHEPGILDLLERRAAGEEARARGSEVNPLWELKAWEILMSQFIFWPKIS